VLASLLGLSGCGGGTPKTAPQEKPVVPISQPVRRDVTDYVDFTGRTEAVERVDILPRVTGYLFEMPFVEGSEVKAGDLLFKVDPRPYQSQLDQSRGQVNLYQAQLRLARATYERALAIAKTPGAISVQELDQDKAAVEEAEAQIKASQSSLEVYRLNVDFTRVVSPIDGQISRYYLTRGNLVNQDQTLLTTIVSLDPMYAYFDMDEPTLLRIRRASNEGRIKLPERGKVPVLMGLQGEQGFPHEGTINFVNNQVNPTTGSILVRGVFANPKPSVGARLLSPGMFVRVRLPIGLPHPELLVIDRAVGSDQGLKFVYVVDEKNQIQYRRVTTGALQEDGLRVISAGLKQGEWVVVGALQQVRPRTEIRPERIPMPKLGPSEPDQPAEPASPGKESSGREQASAPSETPARGQGAAHPPSQSPASSPGHPPDSEPTRSAAPAADEPAAPSPGQPAGVAPSSPPRQNRLPAVPNRPQQPADSNPR
jgi:multidrug efflux system membrane fusion protein